MREFSKSGATTGGKWYDEFPKGQAPSKHSKSEAEVLDLKAEAKKYLDAETSAFQLKQSKSRDSETIWLKTALTQGTASDKVAASIVLIQDNPKYNLARLMSLISQIRASKHNQYSMIITSLRDLFLSDLLHPEYNLLKFEEQNLDELEATNKTDTIVKTSASRNKLLAYWYFEDQLREQYERFITALATVASDTVDTNREKAITVMNDLLIGNFDQWQKLLELIVNKIGDPNSKVASKVVFCLNKLLHERPDMKLVVLREVEKLLFRKNVAHRAQYYSICLLAQFVLKKADSEIAATLIEVYFAFFKACLKKGEPDSRMMAAILTGVNRAYRFAELGTTMLNDHIDSLYKVVHIGSFNVSLNALSLLYQVSGKDETRANRFYTAFYRKLLDPQIGIANKRAVFLNLLHRVLHNDPNVTRLCAFIKRVLQVTLYYPANMTCAILYVISKVIQDRKDVRRILKTCSKLHSHIKTEPDDNGTANSTDVVHIDSENDEPSEIKVEEDTIILSNVTVEPVANTDEKSKIKEEQDIKSEKEYDPFCRNPLFASAVKSFLSELVALSSHFHPSVALFANMIIEGKPIEYTGDPLEDLALIRFLDRYVFKNPKKLESKKEQKRGNPLAVRAGYSPRGIRSLPVGSAAYLNEREERIPVDELFLYRYLKRKNETRQTVDEDDDVESVNSEEFNEMLDNIADGKDLEDMDVAAEIGSLKKRKDVEVDDDLDDDESDDNDNDISDDMASEDEENLENEDDDEELENLSDIDVSDVDEDLSDIDFNEDSDDDIENTELVSNIKSKLKNKGRESKKKSKKPGKMDENIFMSAEKFAEMLEEQSRTKIKHGGTDAFSTIDGAPAKQIDWEMRRNQKLEGTFKKKKRKGSKVFNNKNVKKFKK